MFALVLITLGLGFAGVTANDGPWPAPIAGHVAPAADEHPRLFFRKADVPELRRRAETPEGKQIVARLRELLGGGDAMPTLFNPNKGKQPDGSGDFHKTAPLGKAYTIWHASGFGMLYQLTGEQKYADLARQCVDLTLEGTRDRDNRYSLMQPTGALRAGPSLSAIAMAYDLCFDAWPADYRQKVALEIQNYTGGTGSKNDALSLEKLAMGPRHRPGSNHWGPQVGGAGIAVLAIYGDTGTDKALLDRYLTSIRRNAVRNLSEGFGDGGYFNEHLGPSQIASDTAFMPYLMAERIAGGMDFVSPRPNAQWINLRWAMDLLPVSGRPEFPLRHPSSYGTGKFYECRDGLSRGGQFVQAFATAVDDRQRQALLWTYNQIVEPDESKRTFDLISHYPHRAIFALTSWPIGLEPINPAEVMPKARRDSRYDWFVFRNRWQDEKDALVTILLGGRNDGATSPTVWALGMRAEFPLRLAGARSDDWQAFKDGSGILSTPLRGGSGSFAVDFTGKSGAPVLVVYTGPGVGQNLPNLKGPDGATMTTTRVSAGAREFIVLTAQPNAAPKVLADGDAIKVGDVTITFDGKKLALSSLTDSR